MLQFTLLQLDNKNWYNNCVNFFYGYFSVQILLIHQRKGPLSKVNHLAILNNSLLFSIYLGQIFLARFFLICVKKTTTCHSDYQYEKAGTSSNFKVVQECADMTKITTKPRTILYQCVGLTGEMKWHIHYKVHVW